MSAINTNWNPKVLKVRAISCETTDCLPQSVARESMLTQTASRSVELEYMTREHNNFEDETLLREMVYFDRF